MQSKRAERPQSVGSSLFWKFFERGGVQVIQFIISLIIARILDPKAYGAIALLTVFISLARVFVQSGLSSALVQKKDADDVDFSSVFFYSLTLAAILYAVLFFAATPIANYYGMPVLKNVLRVLALTLFPGAVNSIQVAYLSKNMQFKKQFYSSLIAATLSGGVGIAMALLGFGAWALVGQQLGYQTLIMLILFVLAKWKPRLKFSFKKTKGLLKFGGKILGATLIDTLYHNAESLFISKKYDAETLAFFNKGKQFPLIIVDNLDGAMQSVMFAAYSKNKDDVAVVKQMLRKAISLSTYLVFPAMIGLALVAQPLIRLTLGEKWLFCVPFLQWYCVITMLFPLQTASLQAFNAIGKSGWYLTIMLIKRVGGTAVLIASVFLFDSVYSVTAACLTIEAIGVILNFYPNKKLLGYSVAEQFKDIFLNLLLAVLMGAAVYGVSLIPVHYVLSLVLTVVTGVAAYALLSKLTKNKSYGYLIEKIKSTVKKPAPTKTVTVSAVNDMTNNVADNAANSAAVDTANGANGNTANGAANDSIGNAANGAAVDTADDADDTRTEN